MYRVIIVDDENIIRESLSLFIEEFCPSFVVEQTFEDGKDAIEYLKTTDVDVVITDIRMHETSGLQLAGFIHEFKPEIKTIIISGYKNFEYARTALEYRAMNYLVKPTVPDELKRVFGELSETLENERLLRNQLEDNKKLVTELLPIFRDQFFYDLMTGVLQNEDDIKKRFESLKFDFDFDNSGVCIVEIQISDYETLVWNYEKDRLKLALINLIKEETIDCHYINLKRNSLFLAVILKNRLPDAYLFLENKMKEAISQGEQLLNLKLFLNKMSDCVTILDIDKAFNQIYNDGSDFEQQRDTLMLICSLIRSSCYQHAKNIMNALLENLVNKDYDQKDPEDVKRTLIRLYSMLVESFEDIDSSHLTQMLSNIHSLTDYYELSDFMQELFSDFVDIIENANGKSGKASPEQTIQKAKTLITKNLHRDITLEEISGKVFLNPIYFCRFFKQQTGENFTDYLISVRVQKAKELLINSDLKIYEISAMVSYSDNKHFAKVFKEESGLTPTEYRQKHRKI